MPTMQEIPWGLWGALWILSLLAPGPAWTAAAALDDAPQQGDSQSRLVEGINRLAVDLLYYVMSDPVAGSGNPVCSPFSLAIALGVLQQGCSPDSQADVSKAAFGDLPPAAAAEAFREILSQASAVEGLGQGANLTQSSRAFLSEKPATRFSAAIGRYFNASVQELDFRDQVHSASLINSWVKEATSGKVDQVVSPASMPHVGDDDQFFGMLVNAVHFKGVWQEKFRVQNTVPARFYPHPQPHRSKIKAEAKMVPTMMGTVTANYTFQGSPLAGLKASLVSLPYLGEDASMVFLLPDGDDTADDLVLAMKKDPSKLPAVMDELFRTRRGKVEMHLPKFQASSDLMLLDFVRGLGLAHLDIPNVFERHPAMLDIGEVVQKAAVEVNEESTEAAAATSISISNRSLVLNPVFDFDRPFVYMIVDLVRKVILFMGVMRDPTAS